jgi:hypothetical protein
METKKLMSIFVIIAAVLAIIGAFLPVAIIKVLIIEIEVTCMGARTGIVGKLVLILAITIAVLGIVEIIKPDLKVINIIDLIVGAALLLFGILILMGVKAESPVAVPPAIGFYLILIGAILAVVIEIVSLILSSKSE